MSGGGVKLTHNMTIINIRQIAWSLGTDSYIASKRLIKRTKKVKCKWLQTILHMTELTFHTCTFKFKL